MPVLLGVAAALFAGEHLDRFGWAALVTSTTIGAALIVLGGHRGPAARGEPTLYGDLLVVLSLTALLWILLSKRLMRSHSPVVVTLAAASWLEQ